ncbi:serine hydrolase [Maribacter polysaccharolyticus]|uniref:serine hydrolase n=1 Tax=Maribacter polysaccharolyticus TaxID=3020831 RepID=UPI00237F93E8|nr:serine hydrolase [Maribacter polysaccharolyticus]MDE3741261.1 serine hydrolase [Maribacter polysaccharolyticus]
MKKIFCFLVFTVLISFGLHSQMEKQVDLKALDDYFAKMVKDWDVPGASIGVVKDGELVFTGNYGVLEKGKKGKPDAQTLYAIASNSKAFTSAVIGMLVQEGKLDWDDKVRKYLPYFAMYDSWVSEHITIRDILSHRVGLGTFSGDNIWYKSNRTAEQIIERIQYVPQAYDFRAGYGYSNLMYITAGEIIKSVTGKSWGENVKERILEPLGMDRSIYSLKDLDGMGNYAQPHARKDDGNYVIPWVDWEYVGATGGLISSVEDISKWMIFNLNHGIHQGDTLLTKATRNMVWTPHNNFKVDHTAGNDFGRHFNGYGLGWGLSDYHGYMRVGHTGGYDGFITAINLIPDENLGVVVLTNGVRSPIMAASYYALDTFLGIENGKDWSTDLLERTNKYAASDTRIADRKAKRVLGTKPSITPDKMVGEYTSDLCGKITIEEVNGTFKLVFENHPLLSATLTHWHYEVWEIHWEHPQAWFSFGTLKLRTDNNLKVLGFDFDVPNDDFFFEELKPYKK